MWDMQYMSYPVFLFEMDFQLKVELIALVRKRERLWLPGHPSYHQRAVIEKNCHFVGWQTV